MTRLVYVAVVAALALALVLVASPDHDDVTKAAARTRHDGPGGASGAASAVVSIAPRVGAIRVPRSFLGISTEYWSLPLYMPHLSLYERALSLVHASGDGPLIVRIGGDSADHAFWYPKARSVPGWVFSLTRSWLRGTRRIVELGGVRLILDLNLITASPDAAARWAGAAETALPRGSIVGLEIGNEPDIYNRWFWLATIARPRLDAGLLPGEISASSYAHDFQIYAHSLAPVARRVPLIGPALANPVIDLHWLAALIHLPHSPLRIASAHRYPLSACVHPRSASYPTIPRLLGENATTGVAHGLTPAIRLAHGAGLPFRLTELNSVTCGGLAGVSDTFATALWAPDVLFELLRDGVDGVNVHVRVHPINAAFTVSTRGLEARPSLYGLILFARMLGPGSQLVPLRLVAERHVHLKAWGVRLRGGLMNVLLIDKGGRSVRVDLKLPATGPATVQRLLAPAASSRTGVTLDGQRLGRDGRWLGPPATEAIAPGVRGYEVKVPRLSAALVAVHLRASAGPHGPRHVIQPAVGVERASRRRGQRAGSSSRHPRSGR